MRHFGQIQRAAGVFPQLPRQRLGRRLPQLRHLLEGVNRERRLVAPPAQRHGRHVRAVGLDQQAVGGNAARHLGELGRVLERHRAGKRDVQPPVQIALRRLPAAGIAVHDAGGHPPRGGLALEQVHAVAVRLADVQLHGLALRVGEVELAREHLALDRARRQVVVVVQTDLTPQAALRARHPRKQPRLDGVAIAAGVVRVHADGGIEKVVRLRQRQRRLGAGRIVAGIAHDHRAPHARRAHALEHRGAVRVKRRVRQMTVGINSRIAFASAFLGRHHYSTLCRARRARRAQLEIIINSTKND